MTTVTISLAEDRLARLHAWAEKAGLTPEEFLRRHLDELLGRPDDPFSQAAAYVLAKNAELYRRLA